MNWKLLIGRTLHKAEQCLIRFNSKTIRNNYPYGRDWLFDTKRILGAASVVIDAGANVGETSRDLNYWFPDATIFAFEPVRDTFSLLVKNSAGRKNIHPVNMGLGSKKEKVEILLSNENTINSLKIKELYDHITSSEEIDIVRLDRFLESKDLNYIDILKIDVEGFEFEVMAGCSAMIQSAVKCIYLEVGYEREPTKVHFSDVEAYMEVNGFQLCGIYETRRNLHNKKRLWYSNNLYIKKSLLV